MTNSKFYRVLSLVLAFVMTVSLFSNWSMPVYAETGIKTEPIDPVITTAFKDDEVELYASVEDEALSTEVTGVAGKAIQLYNKVTDESTGEVFYQFRLAGLSTSNLGSVVDEYSFVAADEVVYQEENSKVTETTPELEITEWTYKGSVWVTAKMPNDVTIKIEKITKPLAGTEHWLIWEKSVFFNISITDSEGNPYIPEGGIKVTFPSTAVYGELDKGDVFYPYSIYDANNAISITDGVYEDSVEVYFNAPGIVGITKRVEVEKGTADVAEVVACGTTLTFYNSVYADLVYSTDVNVTEDDVLTVISKDNISNGTMSVDVYSVDYTGENEDILKALADSYLYVLCSEVEEYIEPTPEPPVYEDAVLKDEDTGITVMGSMPEGTNLTITEEELTDDTINEEIYILGDHTKVYDVTLTKDGKEITTNGELTVNIPESELGFELMTGYFLYQVYEDGKVKVNGPFVYSGGDVNIAIDGASCIIYTDPFVEAAAVNWTRYFNKNKVTIYDSPLSIANEYVVKNATEEIFIVNHYFTDKNDTTWYMVYNDFTTEFDTKYVFIKKEDTSKTKVIIPDIVITDEESNTGVLIIGKLPEGTKAKIERVTELDDSIDTSMYPMGNNPFIFDITLYDEEGNETQPDSPVNVVIPAGYFAGNEGKFYIGYHIHDGEIDVLGPFEYTGEDIYVTVDSFSYIMFGDGYTATMLDTPYQAVFTSNTVTLFRDHFSTEISEENSVTLNVTERDIVEVYMVYTFDDGTVKYALDYKLVEGDENFNKDLRDVINSFDGQMKNIVLSDSIKRYVKTEPQTLVDPITGISANGMFPAGALLQVTDLAKESLNLGDNYPLGANVSAFNIKVIFDGEEYQPNGAVTLNVPVKNFNFSKMSAYNLYHTHNGSTSVVGPFVYSGGDINLEIEGFSQFVFTDTFADATTLHKTFHFTNKFATVYDSPMPGAATYTPVEAWEGDFIAEAYYVDGYGTKWYVFYNDMVDNFATEYIYVKEADVSFEARAKEFEKVAPTWMGSPATYTGMKFRALPSTKIADNGLELNKYISKDGQKIVLEVYTTGQKTITSTTTQVPTDIILVLDQSLSMDYDMSITEYIEISGTAREAHAYAKAMDGLYTKVGDKYVEVEISATGNTAQTTIYIPWSTNAGYSGTNDYFNNNTVDNNLYYNDGTGWYPVNVDYETSGFWWDEERTYKYVYVKNGSEFLLGTEEGQNAVPSFASQLCYSSTQQTNEKYTFEYEGVTPDDYTADQYIKDNTYYYVMSGTTDRMSALKTAVTAFAESVAEKTDPDGIPGNGDEVDHKIAVIGFSGQGLNYSGTELFIGSQKLNYRNVTADDYRKAFQDMSTDEGQNNIARSINALDSINYTYVNYGMEMANDAIDAYPIPEGETRNRVIVVFTDGVPGGNVNWNDTSTPTANAAIAEANKAKAKGAIVYAVGIFDDADPSIAGSWGTNDSQKAKANYYMQQMSSNDGTPQTPGYYLAANDGGALNNIFKTIAGNIESGGSSTTLTEETVVRDIVSPYFKLPDGADTSDIIVSTAKVKGKDGNGDYTWETPTTYKGGNVSISGKTINVTNYNFSENWVGAVIDNGVTTYHGSKLIIEIPFEVEPLFLGGNNVPTNDEFAGVYKDDDATAPIEKFESPDKNVDVVPINPQVKDRNVYLTNTVKLADLFTGAHIVYDKDNQVLEYVSVIDGVNNAYVKITFTVYKDNTPIGTYTVPKGAVFGDKNCGWEGSVPHPVTESLITDKEYMVVCTVDGSTYDTDGSVVVENKREEDNIAKVYVYKPIVTVKDSNVYFGAIAPEFTFFNNNVTKTEWFRGTTASTTVEMHGNAPTVELAGTYNNGGVTNGKISTANDILVDLTATANKIDITEYTKFVHTPCSDEKALITPQLKLHVYVPTITFKDAGVYLGATVPTDNATLDETTTVSNWVSKTGKSADNFATSTTPALVVTYTPEKSGTITTTADIGVTANITAGGLDATDVAILDRGTHVTGDYDFVLHVFKPVLSFKDTTTYYGDYANLAECFERDSVVWKHGNRYSTDSGIKMLNIAPTIFGYNMEWATGSLVAYGNQYIANSATDIPVNISEVNVGGSVVALSEVEFAHTDCVGINNEVMPDYVQYNKAEFVVHVNTVSLDVSKIVEGIDTKEKFEVIITYSGKATPEMFGDNDNLPVNVVNNAVTITLGHDETVTLSKLPVGHYIVTETSTPKYNTTTSVDNEAVGVTNTANVELNSTKTSARVKFINKLALTSLTIVKEGANLELDPNQTFMFEVTGPNNYKVTVVIHENDFATIKDLPIDTYTVKELTNWSWRYVPEEAEIQCNLTTEAGRVATFKNSRNNIYWLDGNDYEENIFAFNN